MLIDKKQLDRKLFLFGVSPPLTICLALIILSIFLNNRHYQENEAKRINLIKSALSNAGPDDTQKINEEKGDEMEKCSHKKNH